jgi:FG-GAP repeat
VIRRMQALARLASLALVLVGLLAAVPGQAAASGKDAKAIDPLTDLGQLLPAGSGEALGPVAISGGTVFAGAPATTISAEDQGAVFAFSAPAGAGSGVEHETADLIASDAGSGDSLGGSVSVSGQTVVAGGASGQGSGRLFVFTESAGGWSGVVEQAATLTASDGAKLYSPVISGQTVAALGDNPANGQASVYVFNEPAGGWSGSRQESAMLTVPNGTTALGSNLAVSGSTIVVGSPTWDAVYVFTEPAGGWAGTLGPGAVLTGSDVSAQEHTGLVPVNASFGWYVAVSGQTIVVGEAPGPGESRAAYVFTEPAGGWQSAAQSAELTSPGNVLFPGIPTPQTNQVAISGDTIAVAGSQGPGSPYGPGEVFIYTEPAGGWSGTLPESATLATPGGLISAPVIAGQTVFAGILSAASGQIAVGSGPVYEFNQPAGGWTGTVPATATLAAASSAATAGGLHLFAEPAGGWSSEPPTATLSPSGDTNALSFDAVSASGQTAVASADGRAYVFSEPAGGWSTATAAAELTDSGGAGLSAPVISGATIAAVAAAPGPLSGTAETANVFTEPAGGWSGSISQAATLSAGGRDKLVAVAISGSTIVAEGFHLTPSEGSDLYVFTEPTGGWSGVVHEAATLPLAGGPYVIGIAGRTVVAGGTISGRTVVAPNYAYVFTEPKAGWSGTLHLAATLTPAFYQPGTALVYTEPARGWSSTVHPTALLTVNGDVPVNVAISGRTITVAGPHDEGHGGCPCDGGLGLFTEPVHGWSGELTTAPSASTATEGGGSIALAIDGQTLFAGGQTIHGGSTTALNVFGVTKPILESPPHPPSTTGATLTGLATGKPRLKFKLSAGTNAAPSRSITITFPSGLGLSHSRKQLARGIPGLLARADGKYTLTAKRNKLTLTLSNPQTHISLTIGVPALKESKALIKKRPRKLKVLLRVVDGMGLTSSLVMTTIVK